MNLLEYFAPFFNNPDIQKLITQPFWTVSDQDKRPVNMKMLIYSKGLELWGNTDPASQCVPLFEILHFDPNFDHWTYYLDVLRDGYVILDIEPTCPDKLKEYFLNLDYLYAEKSASGKGYHLLFNLPENYLDNPYILSKLALKGPNNHYELLLQHWTIFTRNTQGIPPSDKTSDFIDVLDDLLNNASALTSYGDIDIDALRPKDIPQAALIHKQLLAAPRLDKTLEDYKQDNSYDHSSFEFGVIAKLKHELTRILYHPVIQKNNHHYNDNERAWLIYDALVEILPWREKHEETRRLGDTQLPWLLYSIARNLSSEKEDKP